MFSGKTVNIQKRIFDLPRENTLSKYENVFRVYAKGRRVLLRKSPGTL
jgi:hypothetical protein